MPFELIEDNAPSENRFEVIEEPVSRPRSIVSAPIKGAVKGAEELTSTGLMPSGPISAQLAQRLLERFLPTRDEPLERGLERGGKLAVSAIGGPESLALKAARTGAGAIIGQAAEELGAPKWLQNLLELSSFMAPKLSKGLLPSKSQKEAVDFLRSKGLTDAEITPLLKSEKKIRTLGRFAKKGEESKETIKGISDKLGSSYDILRTEGAKKYIPSKEVTRFDDKLQDISDKIPKDFQRLIKDDLNDLRNKGVSQRGLIDFYQAINRKVKGVEGGKAVLNAYKPVIMEGLEKIDPAAAKEYANLNKFYAKKSVLAKALKPDMFDKWLSKGKIYGVIGSLATLNPAYAITALKGAAAKEVIDRVFHNLLLNPRMQNLSNKMLESIKNNKPQVALGLYKNFIKELRKTDPEDADSIEKILVPESAERN